MDALDLLRRDRPKTALAFRQRHIYLCPIARIYKICAMRWELLSLEDKETLIRHGWTIELYRDFTTWLDAKVPYNPRKPTITWDAICDAWSDREQVPTIE